MTSERNREIKQELDGFSIEQIKGPLLRARRSLPKDLAGKVILIERAGGIGDMLMALPFMRWLKLKEPTCKVVMGVRKGLQDVVEDSPDVDWTVIYSRDLYKTWDVEVMFKGVIELNPKAAELNGIDCHWEWMGEDHTTMPDDMKIPRVVLKRAAVERIDEIFTKWKLRENFKGVIALQLSSSSTLRTWNPDYNRQLAARLVKEGFAVFTLDQHEVFDFTGPGIFNYCAKLKTQEWMALIERSDVVVGPDSGAAHVAAAVNTPFVGIFSSFDWDLRLRYYPLAVAVQGNYRCAPCFKHHHSMCKVRKIGYPAPCMSKIKPSEVYAAVGGVIDENYHEEIKPW